MLKTGVFLVKKQPATNCSKIAEKGVFKFLLSAAAYVVFALFFDACVLFFDILDYFFYFKRKIQIICRLVLKAIFLNFFVTKFVVFMFAKKNE